MVGRLVAALVLLGDQPDVTTALMNRVMASFHDDTAALRPVWTAADGRRVPGHPVVLPRRLWPAVAELSGDQGARALFEARAGRVRELEIEGAPPHDIDDEGDYRHRALGG